MKRSDNLNELAAALSKAQAEIRDVEKDRANPFFNSKYATLASVWSAIRAPLTKNGLAVIQSPATSENGNVVISTLLVHSSGQWVEDELVLAAAQKTPQGFGSAITYGRRYALMAMVGTAPGDESDDDGNAATIPQENTRQPAQNAPSTASKPKPAAKPEHKEETHSSVFCEVCNTELKLDSKGKGYYCVKYTDRALGNHTYIKVEEFGSYVASKKMAQENDIPF